MPPRKVAAAKPIRIAAGAGITTGLEIWHSPEGRMLLIDRSPDARFSADVASWNAGAAAGLNATATKKLKDAVTTATAAAQ
jgi:hypothetical protein